MKKILLFSLFIFLSGCFGPTKFNSLDESKISDSTQKILSELSEEQQKEFQDAITYFSFGGKSGLGQLFGMALTGNVTEKTAENLLINNLKAIDGLTGEQIIDKYHSTVEQQRIEQEREEAEKNKLRELKNKAEALVKSKNFEEALSTYNAMSEIPSGVEESKAGIEKTTKEMEAFIEKVEFIKKIEITEFETKRISTILKENVPAVRVSLKNNGNRSLDKVEVIVYFKDEDGNTIYEENFHPVLVSSYSFSRDNKPLKPGYVKEMEADHYYTIKSPLSEWKEGSASIKITDIRFSEDEV